MTYKSNTNAWVTTREFQEFLIALEKDMRFRKRKILLLVDNCSSHLVPTDTPLQFVRVHFLPPNTTSHLQPLDAGIIQNFKLFYRKLLIRHYIQCLDAKKPMLIDVKQALYFIRDSWDSVTPTTIANCWRHTGILPVTNEEPLPLEPVQPEKGDLQELDDLIRELNLSNYDLQLMSAEQYVQIDAYADTVEEQTEWEIIAAVTGSSLAVNASEPDAEVDIDDVEQEPVSCAAAIAGLSTALRFFE